MPHNDSTKSSEITGPSRRAFVKAGAWAAPAVALAVAAPTASASTTTPITWDLGIDFISPAVVVGYTSSATLRLRSLGTTDVPVGTTVQVRFQLDNSGLTSADYLQANFSWQSGSTNTRYTSPASQQFQGSGNYVDFVIRVVSPLAPGTQVRFTVTVEHRSAVPPLFAASGVQRAHVLATTSGADGNSTNDAARFPASGSV